MRNINILSDEKSTFPTLVAVCDDEAEQLLDAISQRRAYNQPMPELIFLDVVMDEKDGIELGKELRKLAPDSYLIFITAHPEYAIKGYEARAFRYILKPLTSEKVQEVLAEVRKEKIPPRLEESYAGAAVFDG